MDKKELQPASRAQVLAVSARTIFVTGRLVPQVLICLAVILSTVTMAFSNETATMKFDHSLYMKATATGQKKVGPALKGALCFDSVHKSVVFIAKGGGDPAFQIGYESIKSLLYEQSATPRYAEAVLISPLFLLSNSKKHYLTIQFTDSSGTGKFVIVQLDKKKAQEAIAEAQAETGRVVERVEEKMSAARWHRD